VAGGLALAIRLRFHNHAPQQLAIRLAFHQQAANQLSGNHLSGAAEEGVGEVLGEVGGYGGGLRNGWRRFTQTNLTRVQNQLAEQEGAS
jgi:hypothetical protein